MRRPHAQRPHIQKTSLTHIQDEEVIVAKWSIPAAKHHQLVVDQCRGVAVTTQRIKPLRY